MATTALKLRAGLIKQASVHTMRINALRTAVRAISTRTHTLNTGAKIPAIGFGTFQDPDAQEDAVCRALQQGLRLIDTARVYNVEHQVGKGIKSSGIKREDIFLGTKLWCNNYHPDDVEKALDHSLKSLDTPYVDLLMMHYPCTFARGDDPFPRDAEGKMIAGKTTFVDTWKAMEKLVKSGRVKAIGVSNFSKGELQTLINETDTVSLKPTKDESEANTDVSQGPGCPPDGGPPLSAAERFQQVAEVPRNPRCPVQPSGQHERLLQTNRLEQRNLTHDASHRPAHLD